MAGSPFTDGTVSGTIHYAYQVKGLDATGHCESAASGCVEATATGPCTLPPAFAGLASIGNQAAAICGLTLSWAAATPTCAGPITYNVYRSTTPGFTPGPGNRIANGVTGTIYNDIGALTNGTTYYYVVRAVDVSNGLEEGNTVIRSAAPTGAVASILTDTFEGVGGFDNPGWTHAKLQGTGDWVLSTAQSQSPTHSWLSVDESSIAERVLISPAITPQAGTKLTFWHTFAFENPTTCYDGGTLEVSTNGGTSWSVIPDAAFLEGGFTGTVSASFSNPLAGKRAWCNGTIGPMTRVKVDLTSFAGSPLQLRWHEGDDESIAATGWYVDSVNVANVGVCTANGLFYDGFESGDLGVWGGKAP